jgi:hypothetical protein
MGGHVFSTHTAPIKIENIDPTLNRYFEELKHLFPKKINIFNSDIFIPLGSVGKKPISGDIDLGIDITCVLDANISDKSIAEWNIDPTNVTAEFNILKKRARTSSDKQLRIKAFLKILAQYINKNSSHLQVDEKKVTDGNMFSLFPQIDQTGNYIGVGVQIDWMIGNVDWLKFSYYSSAYPENSNIKGLHRTQLLLSTFQLADLSFSHVNGVKDKTSGELIAENPSTAINVLNDRLKLDITLSDVENYYHLHSLLKSKLSPNKYNELLNVYFKILDSTRADIPDNIQDEWITKQSTLNLTGKFLPNNSKLKRVLS